MKNGNKVIIFGAGFSRYLGIPTTQEINDIVTTLLTKGKSIRERLNELRKNYTSIFDDITVRDFMRTLILLLDDDNKTEEEARYQREKEIERYTDLYRVYYPKGERTLKHRLKEEILIEIDWLALKSIYQAYGLNNIVDLLTILIKALNERVSIPTIDIFKQGNKNKIYYNNSCRVSAALTAYKYIVFKIFKHAFRLNKEKFLQSKHIYYNFFRDIFHYAFSNVGEQDNYLSRIGLVGFNWDMILLFLSMKTNSLFNQERKDKFFYTDLGYPFPRVKLNYDKDTYDYIISRETAYILKKINRFNPYANIVRLFLPHGSINLRVCKRCFTHFFFFTNSIDDMELEDLHQHFLIDPLPDINEIKESKNIKGIKESFELGEPDAVLCPHCKHHTYFSDTYLEVQSIFKEKPMNIMEKIYYEYSYFYGQADSVVAIGYSFPKDDIYALYHMVFGSIDRGELIKKYYTIMNFYNNLSNKNWYEYEDLKFLENYFKNIKENYHLDTITNLRKLLETNFSKLRINFSGFPDFYLKNKITVENLLEKW